MFKDKYIIFVDCHANTDKDEIKSAYEKLGARVEVVFADNIVEGVGVIKL